MTNLDVKQAAQESGVALWKIANRMYGCTDSTFSRKLRQELPPEDKTRIFEIIEELKREVDGA